MKRLSLFLCLLPACYVEPLPPPVHPVPPPPVVVAPAQPAYVAPPPSYSAPVETPEYEPAPMAVAYMPPPTIVEHPGWPPFPGAVWLPGCWHWEYQWVWRHGRWAAPPQPGWVWTHPFYEN